MTGWLARDHEDAVPGIHLATSGLTLPRGVEGSREEQRFAREVADWNRREGGYMHEHSTKPATLAAALSDSPAGLAAWVGEKLVAWSSMRADGSPALTRERMLDTLTLYWATGTIASSLLPYWAFSRHPEAHLPLGDSAATPTAISIFGGERVPFPNRRGSSLSASTQSAVGASTSAEPLSGACRTGVARRRYPQRVRVVACSLSPGFRT